MACECGDEVRVVMNSDRVPGDNGIPVGANRSAKSVKRYDEVFLTDQPCVGPFQVLPHRDVRSHPDQAHREIPATTLSEIPIR
jgi:hypothetical protein